jgi:hypothetical protein
MSLALSFRQEADYLVVEVRGDWTTENAEEGIVAIHSEVTRRGLTRLLLDVRGVAGPDYEVTRFITGQRWAQTFDYRFKTAVWSRLGLFEGLAEVVALNRGANIMVFLEKAQALKWLLDKFSKAA